MTMPSLDATHQVRNLLFHLFVCFCETSTEQVVQYGPMPKITINNDEMYASTKLTDPPAGGPTRLTLPECLQITLRVQVDPYDETPRRVLNSVPCAFLFLFSLFFFFGQGQTQSLIVKAAFVCFLKHFLGLLGFGCKSSARAACSILTYHSSDI